MGSEMCIRDRYIYPFLIKFVPFESSRSQLSIGATPVSNGYVYAKLRANPIFVLRPFFLHAFVHRGLYVWRGYLSVFRLGEVLMSGRTIVVLATLDTKGQEAEYLREQISAFGDRALLVDSSVVGEVAANPDIRREEVAVAGERRSPSFLINRRASAPRLSWPKVPRISFVDSSTAARCTASFRSAELKEQR